jgi:hypothetical protein
MAEGRATPEQIRSQVREARAWLARVDTWLDPKKGEISVGSALACAEAAKADTESVQYDLERLWEERPRDSRAQAPFLDS